MRRRNFEEREVVTHCNLWPRDLCKNGWTDRNAVWDVDSGRGPKEACSRWGAHWCNLANTIEPSVCSGDAGLCQITLTTCLYLIQGARHLCFLHGEKSVLIAWLWIIAASLSDVFVTQCNLNLGAQNNGKCKTIHCTAFNYKHYESFISCYRFKIINYVNAFSCSFPLISTTAHNAF